MTGIISRNVSYNIVYSNIIQAISNGQCSGGCYHPCVGVASEGRRRCVDEGSMCCIYLVLGLDS